MTNDAIDKKTTADKKLFRFWSGAPSTIGNAIKVTALRAFVLTPQIPLPNITAPMYLKGRPAAIENTEPWAVPENAPKITSKANTT